MQGTIVVQASFAVCHFRFFQFIIGMNSHFIQWYVDLLTFRAGNLSLRFPTLFSVASCGTMSAEQEEVVYENGREGTMLLKGEIGSSATFLLGARTRFGRVITLQQSFALLNTSWGWLRCLRVIQNFSWKDFKWNLRLIQSNCHMKWVFRARIRDIWAWKLSSWRMFTKKDSRKACVSLSCATFEWFPVLKS